MEIPVAAALAVGVGFIILFITAVPVLTTSTRNNLVSGLAVDMPASYYLNGCELPSSQSEKPETIKDVKAMNWISVARADHAAQWGTGIDYPCTIVTPDLASRMPSLTTAIRGADGCLDGTEVCQVSYGISTIGDEADYELTITREEAESIAKEIRIGQYNSAMLASGDRFYTMWFNTVDEGALRSAQIETSFLEPLPEKPTPIAAGESLTFTVVIRTWATYGGPAHIDLTADLFARDSGLLANIEPAVLELPERSEAKAVVTITATQDARDGVYSFSVGGVINGYGLIPSGPCEYGSCEIKVGESGWHISTFGSDTQMWQSGPGKVPDWLRLDLETDKMTYKPGEPIEIRSYLSNDGEESLVLDRGSMRLMTAVHGPTEKEGSHVYGIDAYDFDSTDPLVIEPHATVLLVRSFTWDQKTMSWGVPPQQVPAGNYNIDVSLSGYENAVLKDSSIVTIS